MTFNICRKLEGEKASKIATKLLHEKLNAEYLMNGRGKVSGKHEKISFSCGRKKIRSC